MDIFTALENPDYVIYFTNLEGFQISTFLHSNLGALNYSGVQLYFNTNGILNFATFKSSNTKFNKELASILPPM